MLGLESWRPNAPICGPRRSGEERPINRVACVGECMIELVERPDGTLTRGFGGDTLNTALYMARLGMPTSYVTALGDDPFSDEMLRAWGDEGLARARSSIARARARPLLIQTDQTGERRFFYWRDSAPVRQMPSGTRRAPKPRWRKRIFVYLSGITLSLFDEPSRARLFDIGPRARRRGGRVAFDTNFRPRGWPNRSRPSPSTLRWPRAPTSCCPASKTMSAAWIGR